VTPEPPQFPRRFRRRLALTFIAVAGLAGGALAVIGFLLAREYRIEGFENRARREASVNLRLSTSATESFLDDLLATYRQQEGFEVVAVTPRRTRSSQQGLGLDDIPDDVVDHVRSEAPATDLASATTEHGSTRYLVLGGSVPRSDAELYFFFSLEEVLDSLSEFRTSLLIAWVAVAVAAALVGELVARRTLRPVRNAAVAAQQLAEGLLDTRLNVRTEDEFGAWATGFNEMADALAEKIRALSEATQREQRFTADVAHELRTPLAALANASSVLAEDLDRLPAEDRRPAELVVEGIARLRALVADLLELSRLDAGQEGLHLETLALDDAVQAVLRAGGWTGTVRLESEPTPIHADRHRLERLITNLVANAVTHGGRDVQIRVHREDRRALLEVSDGGPGIAPAEIPRLFDRFYKVGAGIPGTGSGLGLAIAQENARLLGGTIVVTSEPGAGATFTVSLPAAGSLAGDTATVPAP
jgi:two-component system sensor histidine kinase MtrB